VAPAATADLINPGGNPSRVEAMTTAVIGPGNIGSTVIRDLAAGGEELVIAAAELDHARAFADRLPGKVKAATTEEAIRQADTVVLAVWMQTARDVIESNRDSLSGKTVVDPTNNIGIDDHGGYRNLNPEGVSAGPQIEALLPESAHYVKAFGTLTASTLGATGGPMGDPVALYYATDDNQAADVAERLIRVAGFVPVKAGGVADAGRIEVFGDLHQSSLDGATLSEDEARARI
jgi:predicted dinucleotide-binding enzyme